MAPRGACLRAPGLRGPDKRGPGARWDADELAGTPGPGAGPPPPARDELPFPRLGHLGSETRKGCLTHKKMEPADEELQQLTAPPARAPATRARAVVACVALASTALLFAVTNKPRRRYLRRCSRPERS